MAKLAALGRRHFVGVFAAVGAEPVACRTPADVAEAARGLAADRAPGLVLLDQHFVACHEAIAVLRRRGAAVIVLPAERAEGHPVLDDLRALIEVAAGANILGEY